MIKEYNNPEEFMNEVGQLRKSLLGVGAEGAAYLTKDGDTLKIIYNDMLRLPLSSDILTTSKINLKSFLLPSVVYTCNGNILGYKTRLFRGDFFYNQAMNFVTFMDLKKLLEARLRMIEDIKALSSINYGITDLSHNILYNGQELAACDTLGYFESYDVLNDNLRLLDDALNLKLSELDPDANFYIDEDPNTEEVINKMIKSHKRHVVMVPPFKC